MIPSITNVRNWTPAVLHDRALAVDGLTSVLGDARDEFATTVSTLWQSWVGRAAETAGDHLDREHRHFRSIAEELTGVSDQLRRADTALTFAVVSARNAIANAERDGFTVDDSGVTAGPNCGAPETATEHAEAIRAAMQTVGELDDHYARALTQIVTNLLEMIPKAAVFSPGEAAHDWASFTDGTLDADETGRVLANLTAAGLDGTALAALAAGNETAMLPAGSIRYLEELYRKGGTEGFLALQHALEQEGSPRSVAAGQALAAHGPDDADTGSSDLDRRDRADRAALGLSTYLSDPGHYERFMDMHGPDTSNLGEVNPELLHAASRGLVGYIPHLAGIDTDSSEWGTRALESSDAGDKRFVHAQRVFSLMATGQDANTTFMGGALAFQETYDRAFVRSLAEPDRWGMISPDTAAAGNSAHIQALIDTGIYGAALEQSRDRENIANFVAERRNQAYDVGYTMMRNAVASFLPANFTVGMGMDMFNPTVRDIFTIPETPTENYAFTVNASQLGADNDFRLARYLVEEAGAPHHPAAVEGFQKAGLLDRNGMLAADATSRATDSHQLIRIWISDAMSAQYGHDHLDAYTAEYTYSYADVAPSVHIVQGK